MCSISALDQLALDQFPTGAVTPVVPQPPPTTRFVEYDT